jgi:hypothetical protein
MKKIITILSAATLIASAASAVSFAGFSSFDARGADTLKLTGGSAIFLVADGGDGFNFDLTAAGLTFTAGSAVGATNDVVISYAGAQDFGAVTALSGNATFDNSTTGFEGDNSFAVLFFDVVSGDGFTTSGGNAYGFYTDASWVIPTANGDTLNWGVELANVNGGAAAGTNGLVIPEPSTYAALAGLCALSFVMVRRRRA